MEGITHGGSLLIELFYHTFVIVPCLDVDREHTARFADTDDFFSGHLPVDITGKGEQGVDFFQMRFFFQYSLIQMGDAPALWNMVVEQLCELLGSFPCDRIAPGAEWHEESPLFVESHIAVHHGRKAKGRKRGDRAAIFFLHIL